MVGGAGKVLPSLVYPTVETVFPPGEHLRLASIRVPERYGLAVIALEGLFPFPVRQAQGGVLRSFIVDYQPFGEKPHPVAPHRAVGKGGDIILVRFPDLGYSAPDFGGDAWNGHVLRNDRPALLLGERIAFAEPLEIGTATHYYVLPGQLETAEQKKHCGQDNITHRN